MIHDDEQQQHQQRLAVVGPKVFLHRSRSDDAICNTSYSYDDVWEGCVDTEGRYIVECSEEKSNISISRSEVDTNTVNLFLLSNDEEEGGHDDDDAYTTITDTYRQHQDETNVISTWHGSTIDKNIVSWHGTNENKSCNDMWQLNNSSSSSLSEVRSFENEHIPCHHNDYDDNSSMSSLTPTPLIHDQAHYNLRKNYISSNPQTNQYNNISSPSNIFGFHSSNNWPTNDVTDNINHSLPQKNNTMIVDEQWYSDSAANNKVLSSPPMEIVLTKKSIATAITPTTTATTIIKRVDLNVTQSLSDCSSSSSSGSVKHYLDGIHNRSYNTKKRFIWCLFAIVFIGIIIAIPTSIMTRPNGVLLKEKEEEEIKPTPNEYNTNVTIYGVIMDREEEDGVMPDKYNDVQLSSTGTDDSMNMTSSPPFFLNLSLATPPAPIITPVRSPIVTDGDEFEVHNAAAAAAAAAAIANDETSTPSLRPTWLKMIPILGVPVVTHDDAETWTPSLRPTLMKMTPILDLPLVARDSNNDDDATTDETLTPSLKPTLIEDNTNSRLASD